MLPLPLTFLHRHRSDIAESCAARLAATGLWNIFNPSPATTPEGIAIAFRAGRHPGDTPFRAWFLPPGAPNDSSPLDLTAHFAAQGIAPVSDPKLVTLDGALWVTFNTGHFERPNRIFAAPLQPRVGAAVELTWPHRQEIEKNWALFTHDGALHAVYALSPLTILRERTGPRDGAIRFETLQSPQESATGGSRGPALSLGPQLVPLSGKSWATIVHRKLLWRGKRLYLGLPARLLAGDGGFTAEIGRRHLAHSPRALLGARTRHNRNLLSCTYFSGLILGDGRAVLGYGVNDLAAAFAEMPAGALGFGGPA